MKKIKQLLSSKQEELNILMSKIEKSLKKAPEGSLVVSHSHGVTQYYHKTEKGRKKGKYISGKNKKFAAALAQKDYDLHLQKVIEEQKKQMNKMIKNLPSMDAMEVYAALSEERKALIRPYILTDEQYVEVWMHRKYSGKAISPDIPEIITERGEQVRSKTEKILADKFYSMGIPYHYEYPVKLKGYGTVYPDFILLNVAERKEFYFEHFGMMDDPEYCQKAILKLEEYERNGIYPGKNLLVTYETLQRPLNMKVVEQMLREFVLT